MQKVVEFLQKNSVQYLATVGRDGKAKCRPFMFCFEQDGKLWFCTNNTKDVYKDMLANPEVEVSVSSPEYAWIRLHEMCIRDRINPRFASGIDKELLESLSERHQMVITMEDGILSGGFGEKIASFYGSSDMKVKNYGLDKKFYDRYDPNELLKEVGMTPVQIIADICNQIK